MRFLCLHGTGTNSKVSTVPYDVNSSHVIPLPPACQIFEMQTAAIRYELGDQHEYDFVKGAVPKEMDTELKALILGENDTYAYFDSTSIESQLKAVDDLNTLVELDGPYDGVITFSAAGTLVATWMLDRIKKRQSAHFKCAIFLSASTLPHAINGHQIEPISPGEVEEFIEIPTAHVWGSADHWDGAKHIVPICKSDYRSVLIHSGGHEVPGFQSKDALTGTVTMMRRAINLAEGLSASA